MFNLKKVISLAAMSTALICCVSFGASAISSASATSGSAVIEASNDSESQHHEFVGGGEWWWGINSANWAYSNYQHRGLEHGSSVLGTWYADSEWQVPGKMASAGCLRNILGTTECHWRTK